MSYELMDVSDHDAELAIRQMVSAVVGFPSQVVYTALFHMIYVMLVGPEGTVEGRKRFTETLTQLAVMEAELETGKRVVH